jgi:hypothetical protein
LVCEIEIRGRLIEQQNSSFGGKCAGQDNPLSFPTRQFVHQPIGESFEIAHYQRPIRGIDIGRRLPAECGASRKSAGEYELENRYRELRFILLRNDGDVPRDLTPREFADRKTVESYVSTLQNDGTIESSEECGLTRSVRTDQRDDLARREPERNAVDDLALTE